MNKIICLWSSPRNISTALMYSFAQREDTEVVDEALYAHYLLQSMFNLEKMVTVFPLTLSYNGQNVLFKIFIYDLQ